MLSTHSSIRARQRDGFNCERLSLWHLADKIQRLRLHCTICMALGRTDCRSILNSCICGKELLRSRILLPQEAR